ncbi:H+/Cl-antiporter ClcA [Actinacidiphila yanglinensis]|uniref:H+/Cl-antiporter ClcA n=1 Tax=Actinacidiphila yanglinensis TaxID=310779 RepID=A0A1H6CU76_9ACTN|nr:chloride channel protein [Actinacidiphila yanglinensis]SEG76514.1 H+/Cl-antiporter ClcA [Actinacidiphila yanglinensis]
MAGGAAGAGAEGAHGQDGSGGSDGSGKGAAAQADSLLRSRGYLNLLVLAVLLGVPISVASFAFLALANKLEPLLYHDLPRSLGFHETPPWWPLPLLAVGAVVTALCVLFLPGAGGHEPTKGFSPSGSPALAALPSIVLAALATLAFGAVLGPEAPLLALGGGLAAGPFRLLKPGLPEQTYAVLGATGSFAAVSSLLGSPLLGAFLLMEAAGLGGPMLGPVLVPGLLASGIGSLIFIGMGSWTGLGTYSLKLPSVPKAADPTAAEFGWALLVGLVAALLAAGVRWLARWLLRYVERQRLLLTVVLGLLVAGLAIAYAQGSGKSAKDVLYSGESAMGPLLSGASTYSLGALVLLVACKSLAYSASLSAFRGGPIFPSLFIGAAVGTFMSHLPGMPLDAGFATGMGAMSVAMLRLPLTCVLLATLLLGKDGVTVMPLVIVSVVVSYVVTALLSRPAEAAPGDAHAAPA